MAKKALIYGVSGQDGTYLCELLLSKKYEVAGVAHRQGEEGEGALEGKVNAYFADLGGKRLDFLYPIDDFLPDEIYNLAGMHLQHITPENSKLAMRVNAHAPKEMLAHICKTKSKARFFQASSAYVFGGTVGKVDENTKPAPNSVYAQSKLDAQHSVSHFRSKGVFAASGILFNHESPLRSEDFVTRKITAYVAREKMGLNNGKPLMLGNLEARRDWGFAGDYVEAMWFMLQQKQPDDYVIATGEAHSVREFCDEAFSHAGLDWEKFVRQDPALFREEAGTIEADAGKAGRELGWKPKVGFSQLVRLMVDADIKRLAGKA